MPSSVFPSRVTELVPCLVYFPYDAFPSIFGTVGFHFFLCLPWNAFSIFWVISRNSLPAFSSIFISVVLPTWSVPRCRCCNYSCPFCSVPPFSILRPHRIFRLSRSPFFPSRPVLTASCTPFKTAVNLSYPPPPLVRGTPPRFFFFFFPSLFRGRLNDCYVVALYLVFQVAEPKQSALFFRSVCSNR